MPPPAAKHKDQVRKMTFKKETDAEKNASCGKKVARVMLSHVGLFVIVAIYAVVGAFVFIKLEHKHEVDRNLVKRKVSLDIQDSKNYIIMDMWYRNSLNLTAKKFKAHALNNLRQFHDFVVQGVTENRYDGDPESEDWDWTFTSSLLFTFTTIAAIGYGHVSPKTSSGKIFCIFYGLIGVPLLLVFLANIGDVFARAFRYTYSRGCCVVCRITRKKSEAKNGKKPDSVFKEKVGQELYMPTEEVQVPITVTLCVVTIYLMVGGVLFKVLEGWKFYESCYFSFITLSTIGFGDLVPGKSFKMSSGVLLAVIKMAATILFSIFGMALLSMCINLIQEQVVNKIKWLAKELTGKDDTDPKIKNKYRLVNADGSVTITPAGKDGNKGLVLQNIDEGPKKKFRKRKTVDEEFDEL